MSSIRCTVGFQHDEGPNRLRCNKASFLLKLTIKRPNPRRDLMT